MHRQVSDGVAASNYYSSPSTHIYQGKILPSKIQVRRFNENDSFPQQNFSGFKNLNISQEPQDEKDSLDCYLE